jgi:acetyl esterase/lipase
MRITTSRMICLLLLVAWLAPGWSAEAAAGGEPRVVAALAYKDPTGLPVAEVERCRLDLYLPATGSGFPTLVWFHGGGLTEGRRDDAFTVAIAKAFARSGIAVASVGYRLSPATTYPGYVEDGAAAFAWVSNNIAGHGGDARTVFIGGHSAGGWLSAMVGLDAAVLTKHGLTPAAIAGVIPVSGQTVTHKTVRTERGLPPEAIVVDEAAPLRHVRAKTPPLLILAAEKDMAARVEENLLLVAALKSAGNKEVSYHFAVGRDHGSIAGEMAKEGDEVGKVVMGFIKRVAGARMTAGTP